MGRCNSHMAVFCSQTVSSSSLIQEQGMNVQVQLSMFSITKATFTNAEIRTPSEAECFQVNRKVGNVTGIFLPLHWFFASLKLCFLCHCRHLHPQSCFYFLLLCSLCHLRLLEISGTVQRISKGLDKLKITVKSRALNAQIQVRNVGTAGLYPVCVA